MARLSVYLPDDLAARAKAAGLNVSALTRAAVTDALTDRGAAAKFLDRVGARGYATEGPGPEAAVKAVRAVRDSWERPRG